MPSPAASLRRPPLSARAGAGARPRRNCCCGCARKGIARSVDCCARWRGVPRENFVGPAYVGSGVARRRRCRCPAARRWKARPQLAQHAGGAGAEAATAASSKSARGSGYSAAALSRLGREVVSVECFERWRVGRASRLERLGIAQCRGGLGRRFRDFAGASACSTAFSSMARSTRPPPNIAGALAEGGVLVARAPRGGRQRRRADPLCRPSGDGAQGADAKGRARAQNLLHGLFAC